MGTTAILTGEVTLAIEEVGGRGDGVAHIGATPVYVGGTLPGERVRARIAGRRGDGLVGELLEVQTPSSDRALPACPHFGQCGGCALQHMNARAYGAWKCDRLRLALARVGLDAPIEAMVGTRPGARRRAEFTCAGGEVGYHRAIDGRPLAIAACPVAAPELTTLLPALRALAGRLLRARETGRMLVTLTEDGPDMLFTRARVLDAADRAACAS
ncbi:MAG: class I SAM-dependent RNA methyltransferase, partial [Alphaproteobacteria bacterium]